MNQSSMYLTMKLIAVFSITFMRLQADAGKGVILSTALAFCCLFLFQYLFAKEKRNRNLILGLLAAAGCFAVSVEGYLPLLLVVVTELIEYATDRQMFYQLSIITGILLIFLFQTPGHELLAALLIFGFTLMLRIMVQKLQKMKEQDLKQKEQIQELRKSKADMNAYTKTARQMAVMEERKRFAAKIHDQLGHGISGSLLLLEGARLQMDSSPERAKETMQKATDNLRQGVESIRMSLRDERPGSLQFGLGEIKAELERFQVEYPIQTKLITEGDLSEVSAGIWICARENLTEILTNMLKHSNGDLFTLKIQVFSKMVRLEYKDNGRVEKPFVKGMGTESIEERTLLSGGKCLFSAGENGFCVTNIFMKEGNNDGAEN